MVCWSQNLQLSAQPVRSPRTFRVGVLHNDLDACDWITYTPLTLLRLFEPIRGLFYALSVKLQTHERAHAD